MADSLWQRSLRDALLAAASASPTPGGGSIAPATGAFGLALIVMALEVTHKRHPGDALARTITEGRELLDALAAHADRDVAAYEQYVQARALPKADEAQRERRAAALQAALREATQTPLAAAEACLESLRFGETSRALVEGSISSDILAGADILIGALKAVLRSAAVNLPSIADTAERQAFAERAQEIEAEAEQVYRRIVQVRATAPD
jgi:formiminotetrahydrofolate cyclodeaminase